MSVEEPQIAREIAAADTMGRAASCTSTMSDSALTASNAFATESYPPPATILTARAAFPTSVAPCAVNPAGSATKIAETSG